MRNGLPEASAALDPRVRPARADDAGAINAIYNHYVRTSPCTFDLVETTLEERRTWLEGFGPSGRHRLLVAEEGDRVLAYACSRTFRPKPAYEPSVETSVYCAPDAQGRGLGALLYRPLFEALAGEDVHRVLAGITLPNPASVRLHRSFGFERVGVFTAVGRKFGRYWDVEWYQKGMDR